MNIYCGSLSDDVTEDDLRTAFTEYGQVDAARVIMGRYSGRSRGFGFVEMANQSEAEAAIQGLNPTFPYG